MWAAVAAAAISSTAGIVWQREYERASPERKAEMMRERKEDNIRAEKRADEERRHQEVISEIRRSRDTVVNHTNYHSSGDGGFSGGFLGGLLGGMFK